MSCFPSRRVIALALLPGFPVIGAMRSYGAEQCFYHQGGTHAVAGHPHNGLPADAHGATGHVHDDGDDHEHPAESTVPPHQHFGEGHSCKCHLLCQTRNTSLASEPVHPVPTPILGSIIETVEPTGRTPVRPRHTLPYSTAPPSLI